MRRPSGLGGALTAALLALASGSPAAAVPEPAPAQEEAPVQAPAAPSEETTAQPAVPAETTASPERAPGPMDFFIAFTRAQLAANGFARHQADVAGGPLVWWEGGPEAAAGPTVILIHGVLDQAGTWFQVAPALAKTHRVLLVDLPGHGESAPGAGPLAMSRVVEGFESWLALPAVGGREAGASAEAPTLVGNSMGAWVALLAALRHPEEVGRVVVINGGGLSADTGDLDLLPKDLEEARRLMAALRDPSSPPTPDAVLDDLVRRAPTGQVARMFEAREDLESYLLDRRLGEIRTPVEILWGESDRYLGRVYAERLLAGLPDARWTLLPQCGHVPQIECAATLAPALEKALATAPSSAEEATAPPTMGDPP